MKILGTGLSGLLGSYVVQHLSKTYEFENLSLETGVDITNAATVDAFFSKSEAQWVFHFAAITDVDGAEKDKELGKKGKTWLVNVGATDILVAACKKYHKKLLYISTDFVFGGGNKVYTEEDKPAPIGWYSTTKYEGEKLVSTLGEKGLIVRISYPYGITDGPRLDFVGRIRDLLSHKQVVQSPIDQIFVPTHISDIAHGIDLLVQHDASGIYHVVGSQAVTSFEGSKMIAERFGLDISLVEETTVKKFYTNRAPRAFHLVISNAKIAELGLKPVSFTTGLQLLN